MARTKDYTAKNDVDGGMRSLDCAIRDLDEFASTVRCTRDEHRLLERIERRMREAKSQLSLASGRLQ